MAEAAQIIGAIALLIFAVSFSVAIFRSPKALKKLIYKDFQAEFHESVQSSPNSGQEVGSGALVSISPPVVTSGEPALEGSSPAGELDAHTNEEIAGPGAYELLNDGEYEKGMALLRENLDSRDDPESVVDTIAFGQAIAAIAGSPKAFADLRDAASANPTQPDIQYWLGIAFVRTGEKQAALEKFQMVAESGRNDASKASAVNQIVSLLCEDGDFSEAISVAGRIFKTVSEQDAKARICVLLGDTYLKLSPPDQIAAFGMYELALTFTPADRDRRFSVAHTYGANSAPALALQHYQRLLERHSDYDVALNNAGVACNDLGAAIASVRYYQDAADQGSTLAMANIARKLIAEGFAGEARSMLEAAQTKPDVHRNVMESYGHLGETERKEEAKLKLADSRATAVRKMRARLASSLLAEASVSPNTLVGSYEGLPGALDITLDTDGDPVSEVYYPGVGAVRITGRVRGGFITFYWRTVAQPERAWSPASRSGHGVLGVNGSDLIGYSVESDNRLDPTQGENWIEWNLRRRPEAQHISESS